MKFGLTDIAIEAITGCLASNPHIEEAILYGSRAKGNYRDGSDIDFVLQGDALTSNDVSTLENQLDDLLLPYKFDVAIYQHIDHPDLIDHIQRVGVSFYKKKAFDTEGGMSEWKECKLGDLIELITKGTTPSTMGGRFVTNGINFIKSESVSYDGKIDTSKFVSIDFETHQKLKRSQLVKDDILFSMAGVFLGKNAIVTEDLLPANTNQALAIIRLNKDKALAKFIHYYLRQPNVIDFVNNISGQSAQPNINFEEIKSIEILLPQFPEQKAIAQVLSSIDDKIDLLHRQNATLEAMAETLFRQWFVEEAKDDWKETSLYNSIELIGGGTPKTSINKYWDGNIKWLSGGDIASNHKRIIIHSEKKITEEGLKNSSAKLLPKYSTVISARGTVGKYCILSEAMTFSQSNYGIKPKFKDCYFFTYLLINHSVEELQSAAYGSVFDTITTDTFKGHMIQLPSQFEIEKFEEKIKTYFLKILNNQTQIRTLTTLRDTLLPKLMSGEVRVKY